jgi:hypothetical protein
MFRAVQKGEGIGVNPGQAVTIETAAAAAVTGLDAQVDTQVDRVRSVQRNTLDLTLTTAIGNCPLVADCQLQLLNRRPSGRETHPTEGVLYCPEGGEGCKDRAESAARTASGAIDDAVGRMDFWARKEVTLSKPKAK